MGRPPPGANACVNRRSIPHLHTPCSPNHHINEQVAAATKNAQATVAVTMPAVAIDDEEESDEMANDERPMHEDQDSVWYGRVTTNSDVFEELMLDSAGFAHDTGRRVRKKDREASSSCLMMRQALGPSK